MEIEKVQQVQKLFSYKDVNNVYKTTYDERPFSEFEIKLFNNEINLDALNIENMENCEILYSICNYFEVTNNHLQLLITINRLLILNDARGYLKLGVYFFKYKNDTTQAYNLFKIGAKKGNLNCVINMGLYYQNTERDYYEAIKYLSEGLRKGNYSVCVNLYMCYYHTNNISEGLKVLKLGLKAGNENCLRVLETLFSADDLHYFLLSLDFSNDIIINKIYELKEVIDDDKYYKNFLIETENDLYDNNFDSILQKNEQNSINDNLSPNELEFVVLLIEELIKQTSQKINNRVVNESNKSK